MCEKTIDRIQKSSKGDFISEYGMINAPFETNKREINTVKFYTTVNGYLKKTSR